METVAYIIANITTTRRHLKNASHFLQHCLAQKYDYSRVNLSMYEPVSENSTCTLLDYRTVTNSPNSGDELDECESTEC